MANGLSECVFCGHTYKGKNALLKAFESYRLKSSFVKSDSQVEKIKRCAEKILASVKSHNNDILNRNFENFKINTIYKAYKVVNLYYHICEETLFSFKTFLYEERASDGTQIGDSIVEYQKCKNDISKSNKDKLHIRRFNKFIDKEVKKLFNLPDNIMISGLEKECGFTVTIDGKKVSNPYDYLSESEIKRLCLIVMMAEIKFSHDDCLILDDPIDSYDDYNKLVSTNYISNILLKRSLKRWYLFTNDFDAVYWLSQKGHFPVRFFLDNTDFVFGGAETVFSCLCSSKEVSNIAKNEILTLADFVNTSQTKISLNKDVLLCSLTLTLRNLKTEIVNKYGNLLVKIANLLKLSANTNWANDISLNIEARAEHFVPTSSGLKIKDSNSLTVGEIAKCFSDLSFHKNSFPHNMENDISPFNLFREKAAKSILVLNNCYTDVIDYMYKKVCIVNYIKYEFEKKLIEYVQNKYTSQDVDSVVNENGFGKKLKKVEEIESKSGNTISTKLKNFENVYEMFNVMFNSFDHSMTLIITPCLSTSVRDIKSFYDKVSSL
jgi:hypothetical protein